MFSSSGFGEFLFNGLSCVTLWHENPFDLELGLCELTIYLIIYIHITAYHYLNLTVKK